MLRALSLLSRQTGNRQQSTNPCGLVTPHTTQQSVASVNQSLSEIAHVMTAMKQRRPINDNKCGSKKEKEGGGFRDSALTALLRHSLGGDCKVRV